MIVEQAILTKPPGGTENNYISFWDTLIRSPLIVLSELCDLRLSFDRNAVDYSGLIKNSSRPDFLCWLDNVLVLWGEEKGKCREFREAKNCQWETIPSTLYSPMLLEVI